MLDKNIKNIIFESERAVGEQQIAAAINYAIDNGFVISMQYKQASELKPGQRRGTSVRYIEPWGIGTNKNNATILWGYQNTGDSTSGKKKGFWKSFIINNIINVIVLDGENGTSRTMIEDKPIFNGPGQKYNFTNFVGKNRKQQPEPEKEPEVEPELSVTAPSQPGEETPETNQVQKNNQQLAEQIKRIKKLIKYG